MCTGGVEDLEEGEIKIENWKLKSVPVVKGCKEKALYTPVPWILMIRRMVQSDQPSNQRLDQPTKQPANERSNQPNHHTKTLEELNNPPGKLLSYCNGMGRATIPKQNNHSNKKPIKWKFRQIINQAINPPEILLSWCNDKGRAARSCRSQTAGAGCCSPLRIKYLTINTVVSPSRVIFLKD